MGLLLPIVAAPFADLGELLALVRAKGADSIEVELSIDRRDIVQQLVDGSRRPATIRYDGPTPASGLGELAAYARSRVAGYFDARLPGGCLRVWAHEVWIDGLESAPGYGTIRQRTTADGTAVFDLRTDDLEAAVATWLEAVSDGPLYTFASAVPPGGADGFLRGVGRREVGVQAEVDLALAEAIARELPESEISWAAGDLVIQLPERTALVYRVAPIDPDDEVAIRELFESCRRQ